MVINNKQFINSNLSSYYSIATYDNNDNVKSLRLNDNLRLLLYYHNKLGKTIYYTDFSIITQHKANADIMRKVSLYI